MQVANDRRDFFSLPRPADVALYRVEKVGNPQHIDYARHPAYSGFVGSRGVGERVKVTAAFLASLARLAVKRVIGYELIPNEVRQKRGPLGRARTAIVGLARSATRRRRPGPVSAPIARELAEQGCAVVVVPPDKLASAEAAAAPSFERLEARRAAHRNGSREFEDSRHYASKQDEPVLYEAMDRMLREAGIIQAASEYLGREADLVDVNPQINDPSDTFWQEVFTDCDLPELPRTAYFHRDSSGGDLKAIVYLTPVTPANGPFAYVAGSHRLPISRLDNFFCEANDHNGLADTQPESRRRFAALARRFRQKGAFGNDLPDDSEASAEIMRSAWSIVGPKGAIVLFDTKGIHRGGMVIEGERRVITCVIG
jgi:hypothetical protein